MSVVFSLCLIKQFRFRLGYQFLQFSLLTFLVCCDIYTAELAHEWFSLKQMKMYVQLGLLAGHFFIHVIIYTCRHWGIIWIADIFHPFWLWIKANERHQTCFSVLQVHEFRREIYSPSVLWCQQWAIILIGHGNTDETFRTGENTGLENWINIINHSQESHINYVCFLLGFTHTWNLARPLLKFTTPETNYYLLFFCG